MNSPRIKREHGRTVGKLLSGSFDLSLWETDRLLREARDLRDMAEAPTTPKRGKNLLCAVAYEFEREFRARAIA